VRYDPSDVHYDDALDCGPARFLGQPGHVRVVAGEQDHWPRLSQGHDGEERVKSASVPG
jgi:hypothetical protein